MARILVLSRRSIGHPQSGGASTYVHQIFRRLANRHEVTVLAGGTRDSLPLQEIDGITYRHFRGPLPRAVLPLRYVHSFARCTDLLIDNADVAVPWLSPFFARCRSITMVHQLVRDVFFDELPRPIAEIGFHLEPLLYRIYLKSKFVAASKSTALDLMHVGIPEENISVISPGCEKPAFSSEAVVQREPNTIACVSRLMRYKGLHFGLEAFTDVVKAIPEASLILAGTGPYEQQLTKLCSELGLTKNVTFAGRLSNESKFKLLRQARVAISPSRREGFGISVLEANSVGTPVVGWNVPGLSDSIVHDVTGLLATYPNLGEFADKLKTLMNDDATWNRLSSNACKWALEHSWERSALQFERLIKETLDNGPQ